MANLYGLLAMAAPMMFPIELPINHEPDPASNMAARAAAAASCNPSRAISAPLLPASSPGKTTKTPEPGQGG